MVFDSWAWWEVLHATPTGARLSKAYLEATETRLLTVDLALAEIAAKLAREGRQSDTRTALAAIQMASEILPISPAAAEAAGALLPELRRADSGASLADAIMLAVARVEAARLVSADACFKGQPDVVRS